MAEPVALAALVLDAAIGWPAALYARIGHPVGGSGVRLTGNLLRALEESGGRYGLQTMCESGGMANATLLERIGD